ncbi:unnamed protein product [Penicillium salamii]|uniref:Translation elongation factor eEF-1B gamma subunit n=1 Tax=Penicillium salamii TaxID=1612424 RepID=A0A9W4N1D1_9EURO|nr:unnamed protein product [Penicillium salamii]CAG8361736.1 unnamed protein product [Penicillium salamii]CAG8361874.1 unnamed protein product [Penicillium salamii]CAG8368360.1 unnamed protein product [Penicillium salamii]
MAPFGTIYSYTPSPRVVKAQAAANLNGLELSVPEFTFGQTNRTPDFISKFPLGKVPAFEGADGTTLFESDAITQYIAESGPAADQLVGATPAQRAQIRQWICYAQGEVLDPVSQLALWRLGIYTYDAKNETTNAEKLHRSLACLDLADITVAAALIWGFATFIEKEDREKYPSVVAWYERTIETEGVKQAFGEKKYIDKRSAPPS